MFTSITSLLSVLLVLAHLIQHQPTQADQILFEIAKATLTTPTEVIQFSTETNPMEHLPNPDEQPFLSDLIRDYVEQDPQGLLQQHIRGHPQATMQAIALARLQDISWKDLSTRYQIEIPTLSNFYQRRLRELASDIKQYLQEQSR